MEASPTLQYVPPWYIQGDADIPGMAVAYGMVALFTIWLLEYIAGLAIFSNENNILLSDAAAHVTFSNSSWKDLSMWIFGLRRQEPVCRRALLAIVLRFAIIIADLAILVMSIPRSVPVFENQVSGSTQMEFRTGTQPEEVPTLGFCKRDTIQYGDFSTSVSREICLTTYSRDTTQREIMRYDLDRYLFIAIQHLLFPSNVSTGGINLFIWHINWTTGSTIVLGTSLLDEPVVLLHPIVDSILADIANVVYEMKLNVSNTTYSLETLCEEYGNEILSDDRFTGRMKYIRCRNPCLFQRNADLSNSFQPGIYLFERASTRKISNIPKVKGFQRRFKNGSLSLVLPTTKIYNIGSVNRPRLCIFPALILLGSLAIVACILRMFRGKPDLAIKLWEYLFSANGLPIPENILHTRCQKI